MGFSDSHSLERSVLRLVGAVGETAAAGEDWRKVLGQGVLELFHVKVGAVSDIGPVRPAPNPRPKRMTDFGLTEGERNALFSYIHDPDAFDPFLSSILAGPRVNRVVTRRDIVPDDNWYGITLVEDYMLKAGLDDVLAGIFIGGVGDQASAFMTVGVRAAGERPFGAPEVEAMRMLQQGLAGWSRFLVDHPTLAAPQANAFTLGEGVSADALPRLSPRLRQLLDCFIQGKTEPQAADEMRLSRHTVHMHAKRLYRAMDVNTRAELVAKALRSR
jgi:DNA-binding CsgD family transcriptional regulator